MSVTPIVNDTQLREIYSQVVIVPWIVSCFIFAIVAAVLNAYTFIVILYFKSLRLLPHYVLIVGVAFCALLSGAVRIPICVLQIFFRVYYFKIFGNDAMCTGLMPIFDVICTILMFSQMMIAINRSIAVFAPIFFQRYMTIQVVVAAWLLSAVFASIFFITMSYFLNWLVYKVNRYTGDCDESNSDGFLWLRLTITYLLPLVVSLILYVLILFRIILSRNRESRQLTLKRARGCMPTFTNVIICVISSAMYSYSKEGSRDYTERMEFYLWMKFFIQLSYTINPVSGGIIFLRLQFYSIMVR